MGKFWNSQSPIPKSTPSIQFETTPPPLRPPCPSLTVSPFSVGLALDHPYLQTINHLLSIYFVYPLLYIPHTYVHIDSPVHTTYLHEHDSSLLLKSSIYMARDSSCIMSALQRLNGQSTYLPPQQVRYLDASFPCSIEVLGILRL